MFVRLDGELESLCGSSPPDMQSEFSGDFLESNHMQSAGAYSEAGKF